MQINNMQILLWIPNVFLDVGIQVIVPPALANAY
jgi:hypothetical protein